MAIVALIDQKYNHLYCEYQIIEGQSTKDKVSSSKFVA